MISRLFKRINKRIVLVALAALLISSMIPAVDVYGARETGGYPWHDASIIRATTYDWGYVVCQPAMRKANMCTNGHTSFKYGVRYYQSDPWHYDVRNCTSFVAWRINKQFGKSLYRWGDAKNWASQAIRNGYQVNSHPAVGSIAWWNGYHGHVAVVVAVNSDGSVNVEQYNKAGRGEFSRQSRVRAQKYIHIQKLKPSKITPKKPSPKSITKKKVQTNTKVTSKSPAKPKVLVLSPIRNDKDLQYGLPSKEGFDFTIAVDPLRQTANVYAVQDQFTASGMIEISKSNYQDGNTTWERRWTTRIVTNSKQALISSYNFADANADGVLDMYIVRSGESISDITIVDGASGFTKVNQQRIKDSLTVGGNVSIADYNGDGKLDIYSINKNTPKQIKMKVLDGASNYTKLLTDKVINDNATTDQKTEFVLGDHNKDGLNDLIQIVERKNQYAINVFNLIDEGTKPIANLLPIYRSQTDSEQSLPGDLGQ